MEEKLAEYRAKKRLQHVQMPYKDSDALLTNQKMGETSNPQKVAMLASEQTMERTELDVARRSDEEFEVEKLQMDPVSRKLWVLQMALKLAIWLVMYAVFVKLEFGAVYFAISVIVFIVSSLTTRRRGPNQLSAYSVFNPNFEVLDGTLTAQQFDDQMRHGGLLR